MKLHPVVGCAALLAVIALPFAIPPFGTLPLSPAAHAAPRMDEVGADDADEAGEIAADSAGEAAATTAPARPTRREVRERCALFDEIWGELSRHDAFFDPKSPDMRTLRSQTRERLARMPDETERLRELVRVVSRLGDGHVHLTTRWFMPDKPPPPLPLAGKEPLYRPKLARIGFQRDHYVRHTFADEPGADGKPRVEYCRLRLIDGALVTHGSGWSLLNGLKDSEVELELERKDGRSFSVRLKRTEPVVPPTRYGPTSRAVVRDKEGRETEKEVEVVVRSRRIDDNIGHIRIEHLVTQQVVADFDAALNELMDTRGLILDLRGTGGGYPWIMLPIAGRFFSEEKRVCTFDGRSPLIASLVRGMGGSVAPTGKTYTGELVVLIDDGTGSMSEGLSFSLGDTGRALLIGRPTKGLNAAIRNTTLSNGMVLWHSWVRVSRLDGEHYQGVGVQPHELVCLDPAEALEMGVAAAQKRERAMQDEHALRRLRERIDARRTAAPEETAAPQESAAPGR
ncbi:MAG: hypothetical protein IPM64_15320 [Phycisphaerales bacterium]|nr:hypothetical protein [Phycisphaerales bacterium]